MARCDEYRTYWESQYEQAYESGKAFWRAELALTPELMSALDRHVLPTPPSRVIEVGCGDGLNAVELARRGYDVVGIDVVSAAIERARSLASDAPNLHFICGDIASDHELIADTFDLWIDIKTLHCLWEDARRRQYFQAMRRQLKPGGVAYLNVGLAMSDVRRYFPSFFATLPIEQQQWADRPARDLPPAQRVGIRTETIDYLINEFTEAGFEISRAGYAIGRSTGWGAIIIARKPLADSGGLCHMPLHLQLENMNSDICRNLSIDDARLTYLNASQLNAQAFESNVYEVVAMTDCEVPRVLPNPVILKRASGEGSTHRFDEEAAVLTTLHEQGCATPKVLSRCDGDTSLVLEWAGPTSLADRLKQGEVIPAADWRNILAALAQIHRALPAVACESPWPTWQFSHDDRLAWAHEGLSAWLDWPEARNAWPKSFDPDAFCQRLADRLTTAPSDEIIWGDCNPKNIVMNGYKCCFIDPHPKRGSIFLDLVLLFAFADSPETYIPRDEADEYLSAYWDSLQAEERERFGTLETFTAIYDDELLWRIFVYGGKLLVDREKRITCCEAVCRKLQQDFAPLVDQL